MRIFAFPLRYNPPLFRLYSLHFPVSDSLRILGIDPGLNHTGYGVIDAAASSFELVAAGCIHVPRGDLCQRLAFIHEELSRIIKQTHPSCAAAEIIFLNINPKTTLLLGQARGAAIACAAVHGLHVHEFTPSEIKQSVVGTGAALKSQIQHMVMRLLGLQEIPQSDAADALACAITCANSMKLKALHESAMPASRTGVRSLSSRAHRRGAWEQFAKQRKQQS
jgi:crossover junction endodeoxyribonuclease RuvC